MNIIKDLNLKYNKYIPPIINVYLLLTFIFLIAEIFIYPGIIQKYLKVDVLIFLIISILLTPLRNKIYKSNISDLIILFTVVLIPVTILLSIQENTHYQNFIFSTYHISLRPLQYLLLYLLAHTYVILCSEVVRAKKNKLILFLQKPIIKVFTIIVFSITFGFVLVQYNFNAKWSIIDDHEIVYLLGSNRAIKISDFPNILSKTEVVSFGTSLRYRPSYYILRTFEVFLWRDNPQMWYIARYIMLVIFLFTLTFIISQYFGEIFSILFSMFIMTDKYWSDVWIRLGPAEIYVALGLSLFSIGFFALLKGKTKSIFLWILIFFGGLISIGSKENMIILAIPCLYVITITALSKQWNWRVFLIVLNVIYSLLIFVSIAIAVNRTGIDIYAHEINPGKTYHLAMYGLTKTIWDLKMIWFIAFGVLIGIAKILFPHFIHLRKFILKYIKSYFLLIFLLIVYVSQFIFYSGTWPSNGLVNGRYDFPGILAKQIFWLVWLYLLINFIKELAIVNMNIKSKIINLLNVVIFSLFFLSILNRGYVDFINLTIKNSETTALFTSQINDLYDIGTKHPDYVIIIKSRNPWDYEPIYSIERFLRFMGIHNNVYLDYQDTQLSSRSQMEKGLSESLYNISFFGMSKNNSIFQKYDAYKIDNKCILVPLFTAGSNGECPLEIRID